MDMQLFQDVVITAVNFGILFVFAACLWGLIRWLRRQVREKEVVTTFSAERYARAKQILDQGKITNITKTTHTGMAGRSHRMGRLGENPAVEIQYQIFVPKERYEEAVHLLNQGM